MRWPHVIYLQEAYTTHIRRSPKPSEWQNYNNSDGLKRECMNLGQQDAFRWPRHNADWNIASW